MVIERMMNLILLLWQKDRFLNLSPALSQLLKQADVFLGFGAFVQAWDMAGPLASGRKSYHHLLLQDSVFNSSPPRPSHS